MDIRGNKTQLWSQDEEELALRYLVRMNALDLQEMLGL